MVKNIIETYKQKIVLVACLLLVLLVGCNKLISQDNQQSNAQSQIQTKCNAPSGFCCLDNGKIVEATGQLGNAHCRDENGYCYGCKCLSTNTKISTPEGEIPVQDLKAGMLVWTEDEKGNRVAVSILKTSRTQVSKNYLMEHIVLDDERELLASSGHPTSDGRTLGQIEIGDNLDSTIVLEKYVIVYDGYYTYDILPAGRTGTYWANGILLKSTLS